MNFAEVHQAVPGRRIAYAAQNAHIFTGTIAHNLYYGLKHRPVRPAAYDEAGERRAQQRVRDAVASGNSPYDVRADWIDYETAGAADEAELTAAAVRMLKLVEMEREVIGFGFASTANPARHPTLAQKAVAARARVRERVASEHLEACVEFFDRDAYFDNMSIAENILFGTILNLLKFQELFQGKKAFIDELSDVQSLSRRHKTVPHDHML